MTKVEKIEPSKSNELRFKVELLSNGKLGYPASLEFRPLKTRDVKIIASSSPNLSDIDFMKRLMDVVNSTILTSSVSVGQLSLEDFTQILVAHRINSIKSTFDLLIKCPHCKNPKRFDSSIDLTTIKETPISESYTDPFKVETYTVSLPRMNVYLTPELKPEDLEFALMANAMGMKTIDDIEWKDYLSIKKSIQDYSYGIDTSVKIPCKFCKEDVEFSIPFREEFFFA